MPQETHPLRKEAVREDADVKLCKSAVHPRLGIEAVAIPGHRFDLVQIVRSRRRSQHLGLGKPHSAVVETEDPPVDRIVRRRDNIFESAAHRKGDAGRLCGNHVARECNVFGFRPPFHQLAGQCLARELL